MVSILRACGLAALALSLCDPSHANHAAENKSAPEEVMVWGDKKQSDQAGYTNPTSVLLPEDMAAINVATTEDLVKFEPSLVIRRRFIGDANGTLGMRGSNMFQTSRSMVFADGVPLHYFLQSRWSGAPRWTLVSASEIAQVEVIYGPFSAEHSGNAMGGVVLIETAIPQTREAHLDASYFFQDFSAYGFDRTLNGHKAFISYGDKIGNLSLYASYNRLENDAQPQTFHYGSTPGDSAQIPDNPVPVSGGLDDFTELNTKALVYGDTGVVRNTTDNLKLKLGYDFGDWQTLLNIAYEDRAALTDAPNSYLRNEAGETVWRGAVTQSGNTFTIPANRFAINEQDRRSLSSGLRLKGDLGSQANLEANLNRFAILEDETRNSDRNPRDPAYNPAGSVHDFENTGWKTADIKLSVRDFGLDGLNLISGLRGEAYSLNLRGFDSGDYTSASRDEKTSHSGGKTRLNAFFLQLNWDVNRHWDLSLGGRMEFWKSRDGYYWAGDTATSEQERVRYPVPGQSQKKFSPKFALGYKPDEDWMVRYSLARAYRFPIVEELFSRYQAVNQSTTSDPTLQPEDGLHQNLLLEHALESGYVRVNLFHETIQNVIENQTSTQYSGSGQSITTFFPIDEVETLGVEWIINAQDLIIDRLDVRFNLTYMESEIIKNRANPALEGKVPPRMPKWRGNLLATYHISDRWDLSANAQYATKSYGRADNLDTREQVYGAQDGYTRLGCRTSYRFDHHWKISAGVDNLTDEISYVAHPWPARTVYFSVDWGF
jgi:iron complex outermembrane receptor protein